MSKHTAGLPPMLLEIYETVIVDLTKALLDMAAPTPFDGPRQVSVLLKDGTYRKKTLLGEMFYFDSIRVGARDILFTFVPEEMTVDDKGRTIVNMDTPLKDLDKCFPEFFGQVHSALFGIKEDGYSVPQKILDSEDSNALIEDYTSWLYAREKEREKAAEEDISKLPNFGIM